MNPSANGWIKKYFSQHEKFQLFPNHSKKEIIAKVRQLGFTYGLLNYERFPEAFHEFKYTKVELSKICYLQLLEQVYFHSNDKSQDFLPTLIDFYEILVPHKNNLFTKLFSPKKPEDKVEEIFISRWKDHFFSQSAKNDLVLNMILLCLDVLAFEKYLLDKTDPNAYTQTLAHLLEEVVLAFKKDIDPKGDQDKKLISFLQKSITINSDEHQKIHKSELEIGFISDFTVCNAWNNTTKEIKLPELNQPIFELLELKKNQLEISAEAFKAIVQLNANNYQFYKSTNLFGNILTNSTSYIEHLLSRNKTRIVKEMKKDAQLMNLLAKATTTPLTEQEKKIVKTQSIEVIKTVPSLAIFLLPGGTVMLPIILRFIPTLLPSAFNENIQQDD
ncbi:LETM1-related biofilm-associated protein [Myroides sp. LJL115]